MEDPKEILNKFGFSNMLRMFLREKPLEKHLFPLLATEFLRKVDKACKGRYMRQDPKDELKIKWVRTNRGRIIPKETYDGLISQGIKDEDL